MQLTLKLTLKVYYLALQGQADPLFQSSPKLLLNISCEAIFP